MQVSGAQPHSTSPAHRTAGPELALFTGGFLGQRLVHINQTCHLGRQMRVTRDPRKSFSSFPFCSPSASPPTHTFLGPQPPYTWWLRKPGAHFQWRRSGAIDLTSLNLSLLISLMGLITPPPLPGGEARVSDETTRVNWLGKASKMECIILSKALTLSDNCI